MAKYLIVVETERPIDSRVIEAAGRDLALSMHQAGSGWYTVEAIALGSSGSITVENDGHYGFDLETLHAWGAKPD